MQRKPNSFKFDALIKKIENSRYGSPKIRGKNVVATSRTNTKTGGRVIEITHYDTVIATIREFLNGDDTFYNITINSGGYSRGGGGWGDYKPSVTTKHYLNEILECYKTGVHIYQKNFEWFFSNDKAYYDNAQFIGVQ